MKKVIPFIPVIGAIIVAFRPEEDYGLSNSVNRIASIVLQSVYISVVITILIFL